MFRVHTFYEQEKIDTEMQCTVYCYKQFCGYKVIEVVALICFCTRFAKSVNFSELQRTLLVKLATL